jgi:hypothetical protein
MELTSYQPMHHNNRIRMGMDMATIRLEQMVMLVLHSQERRALIEMVVLTAIMMALRIQIPRGLCCMVQMHSQVIQRKALIRTGMDMVITPAERIQMDVQLSLEIQQSIESVVQIRMAMEYPMRMGFGTFHKVQMPSAMMQHNQKTKMVMVTVIMLVEICLTLVQQNLAIRG